MRKALERTIIFVIPTRLPDHPFNVICITIFQGLSEEKIYSLLLMMCQDTSTYGKGLEYTKSIVSQGTGKKHPGALVRRIGVQEEETSLPKMLSWNILKVHLNKTVSVEILTANIQ